MYRNYEKSLTIVEEHPVENVVGSILINMGLLHFQKGDFDKALDYFEKSNFPKALHKKS